MDACDARCRPGRARGVAVACCSTDPNFEIYNVALAGDRLAFGVRHGAGAAGACEGSKICLSPPRSVLLWSPPARLRASTGARGNRLIWRFSRGAPTFLGLVWGSTGASRMFVTARFEGCHAGTLGNLRGNLRRTLAGAITQTGRSAAAAASNTSWVQFLCLLAGGGGPANDAVDRSVLAAPGRLPLSVRSRSQSGSALHPTPGDRKAPADRLRRFEARPCDRTPPFQAPFLFLAAIFARAAASLRS